MCKLILLYCRLAVPTLHRASYNWPALRVLVLRLTPLCINRTFRVLDLISKRCYTLEGTWEKVLV